MTLRRFALALTFALALLLQGAAPARAIIGGTQTPSNPGSNPATQSAYPWNALIHISTDQSNFTCGATLIGSRFAITAAHCVDGASTANMYVTVGGYDLAAGQQTGTTVHVNSYIQHPDFNISQFTNDLALVILDQNVPGVETPIYITQTEIGPGRTATIIGWGSTYDGGPMVDKLREAEVQTIDRATCLAQLSGYGYTFDANTICAGVASGAEDTCAGDSGGPLFIMGRDGKPIQIGVTSWGVGCGLPNLPGAYSNLATMLGFLLDNLGGQSLARLVDYAVNGNQRRVAQILDQIGPAAASGSALRRDYGRLFMNGVGGTATSLQSLLPTSAFEAQSAVSNFVSMNGLNLMSRLRALRDGRAGGMLDVSGLRLENPEDLRGSGARAPAVSSADPAGPNGLYDIAALDSASVADRANPNQGRMYDPALYAGNTQAPASSVVLESDARGNTLVRPLPAYASAPQVAPATRMAAPTQVAYAGQPLGAYTRYVEASTRRYEDGGVVVPLSQQYALPSSSSTASSSNLANGTPAGARLTQATDVGEMDQYVLSRSNEPAESRAPQVQLSGRAAHYAVAPTQGVPAATAVPPGQMGYPGAPATGASAPVSDMTRATDQAYVWTSDLFGARRVEADAQNGLPRGATVTDRDRRPVSYRGQPGMGAPVSSMTRETDKVLTDVSDLFGARRVEADARNGLPREVTVMDRDRRAVATPAMALSAPVSPMTRDVDQARVATSELFGARRVEADAQNGLPRETTVSSFDRAGSYTRQPGAVVVKMPNQYAMVSRPAAEGSDVAGQPESAARYGTVAIPYTQQHPPTINPDRRWGVFVSGDVRFGEEKLLHQGNATTVGNTGFSVGLDYRVTDKTFVGLALTYAHGSFTTRNFSDVQSNGYAVSLYGTTTFLKRAYLDGFLSLGLHNFESERTLYIGNGQIRTAEAEPEAMHFSGEVETGYDFAQGPWKLGPFAGFRLFYADYDAYNESGAGSFNLGVHGRDDYSAIGSVGFGVARAFAVKGGHALVPALRLAFNHEFGNDQTNIRSHFLVAPTLPFKTEGARRERNWMSVNPSVSAALTNNWMLQAFYAHDLFRDEVDNHVFNLAARYKW